MRRKLISFVFLAACGALLAGCKKDAEFNEFSAQLDSLTAEIVKKVDDNPTTAGVDDAQKLLDSKKGDMKAKLDAIKNVREAQLSEETKKKFTESLTKNMVSIVELQSKHMNQSIKDPEFKSKLDKLTKDYQEMFKM